VRPPGVWVKRVFKIPVGNGLLKLICRSFVILCFWYIEQKGFQKLVLFPFRKYKVVSGTIAFVSVRHCWSQSWANEVCCLREWDQRTGQEPCPLQYYPISRCLVYACRLDGLGFISTEGQCNYSSPKRPDGLWHTDQRPLQWAAGFFLALTLRMSESIPLLPLHTLMAWAGTPLP
jgi:hypothetical protein